MQAENKRGTGRTTRMLADAVKLAREGRAVYVMACTHAEAKQLERFAGNDARQHGVKFETEASIGDFDWNAMRGRGMHPNCIVLVDHHAIERKFAAAIEMMQRYDA